MRGRCLIVLLSLYVTLDFANPFMPGAFNFDPGESVDGARLHHEVFRSRLAVAPTPSSIRDGALRRPVVAPPPAEPPAASDWSVSVRQRQSSCSSEPSPLEDH